MTSEIDREMKPLSTLWWLLALLGVISLGVGIFFIASPHETLSTFTVIAGILLVVDGVLALIAAIFGRGEGRGLLATVGVLGMIAGVILIRHPFNALIVFIMIIGIWFIAAGAVRLVAAFANSEGRGANIILSVIDIVAGIVIVSWPDISLATLAVILGIFLVLRGFAWIYAGFALRGAIKDVKKDVNAAEASV